ncbi:MAG: hypothetical protein SCALA701_36500 [Candidatus Scalindua sp.]|nr:MAG: hypothetical protein SCALA701_36500 [Candidatus Scalindua sp.]
MPPLIMRSRPKNQSLLGTGGGESRYPILPVSRSKALLKARVPPFNIILQIMAPRHNFGMCVIHPDGDTAIRYPTAI